MTVKICANRNCTNKYVYYIISKKKKKKLVERCSFVCGGI